MEAVSETMAHVATHHEEVFVGMSESAGAFLILCPAVLGLLWGFKEYDFFLDCSFTRR